MLYPGNYGYIPKTLSGDGDPLDVLLITEYPILPGSIIRARIIGVLLTTDEKGNDEKIIAFQHQMLIVIMKIFIILMIYHQ